MWGEGSVICRVFLLEVWREKFLILWVLEKVFKFFLVLEFLIILRVEILMFIEYYDVSV